MKEGGIEGWYYLHVNGELIYKPSPDAITDIRGSDLCRAAWPIDPSDRKGAWVLLIEAGAAGANALRLQDLARKWRCNDADAREFCKRIGCKVERDGAQWCATRLDFVNLQESPAGFGPTALQAMTELCKALGYKPATMWAIGFEELLRLPVS